MSNPERGKAVLGLDPLERKVGLIGAALAAFIGVVATVPYLANPKAKVSAPAKGTSCPVGFHYQSAAKNCLGIYPRSHWLFELGLLLLFAVALYVTVRMGRRGPLGFVALMAGLAFMSNVQILGVPFIAAGGWLLIRASRVQRYGSPSGTRANPTGERKPPPPRAERAARAKKSRAPEPKGPVASKRYTPKAPKRKRPAPIPPES